MLLACKAYLSVPRVAGGRAGRAHGGEDVRRAEGGKPLLPFGLRVGPNGAPKHALCEQDQRGAESLRVERIGEGEVGQVSAVADEERLTRVDKFSLDGGNTVLGPEMLSEER